MNPAILQIIKDKGLLLEKEVLDILDSFDDSRVAGTFLEQFVVQSGQKMITKSILNKNASYVHDFVEKLPGSDKYSVERIFIKFGISVEVKKERIITKSAEIVDCPITYQVHYANTKADKKLEVQDFVSHFRSRYQQLQRILMTRSDLSKLMSINKISSDRQNLAIIGIISDKRVTKNKNLVLTLEDLTGKINVVIRLDKEELAKKANELQLDDIIAVKASGSRDILFAQDIFYPDAFIAEKTKFDSDVSIAFISDIHCGSNRHLAKSMQRFLDWIKSDDEQAKKIRFLFIPGDTVDGVGIFPGQENLLTLKSMKDQYSLLASYLRQVPKHITMFLCPGQHDASRVAEPQPIIDKKYAPELFEIENLILVTNPTLVKLIEKGKEFKVLMYHGASIHSFINNVPELREMKAHKTPAKAVKHMLKRRHLAPVHSSAVYIPYSDKDPLVISEVPDILCTGEVHRLDIENYNGVLIITGSCWQAQTPFEEKVGNIPDPGKVPVVNLKTRELKIFDFSDEEEIKNIMENT